MRITSMLFFVTIVIFPLASELSRAETGKTYDFSFQPDAAREKTQEERRERDQKLRADQKQKRPRSKKRVTNSTASPVPQVSAASQPSARSQAPTLAPPLPGHSSVPQTPGTLSYHITTSPIDVKSKRSWRWLAALSEVADRTGRVGAPLVGANRLVSGNWQADTQLWMATDSDGRRRFDGSLGAAFRIPIALNPFSLGLAAGFMTTPGDDPSRRGSFATLAPYYGFEVTCTLQPPFEVVSQLRLQDSSRFGLATLGVAQEF